MRFKTIKNVLDKEFETLPLAGIYKEIFGEPEANGLWLIYGPEKHGKSTFSLIWANYLSTLRKTAYIMAEQGFDKDFQDLLNRLSIGINNSNFLFQEYVPIEDLDKTLKKRKQPDIIFLDNLTIYQEELKGGALRKLILSNPTKLFMCIAHEEKGEPYTAVAKLAKKLAKRIIRIEGMKAIVEGRSKGGTLNIDDEKAALYWGEEIVNI